LTEVECQIGLAAPTVHPDLFRKKLDILRILERVQVSTFASVKTVHGKAGLRDLTSADLPAIVDYWLLSPDEHLDFMGVNRQLLGSSEDIHRRFLNAVRTGDPSQSAIALAITLDERLVGYTVLNRYSEDVNYSHWHIIVTDLRGKGLSTALYPFRIKAYFDVAPISRLIHQTRTRNLGVNRMLDKFILVSETKLIDKPDGVASPGEFHVRYARREDIPRFFARAVELGTIPRA
jgi:RimJ/RimL family protein N-acetyltransferase